MMFSIKNRGINMANPEHLKVLKEAAKDTYESGKLAGPVIAQTAAYRYFKGLVGL